MIHAMNILLCALLLQNTYGFKISMTATRDQILKPFRDGNAFKVISGLNNFNTDLVRNVATAAQSGGASHIDIACDPDLVKIAKAVSTVPICVSSVQPENFVAAVKAGADMIEIGNFDCFYDQGITFSAEDVLKMTRTTRELLPSTVLSVTVPHNLQLHEQVDLAKRLEEMGADIIQTEGKVVANTVGMGVQELIETAAPTLAAAFAISRAVSIPVMCASGLTDVTAPLALAAGARGVGIGSIVNKLPTSSMMTMAVTAVAAAIGRQLENIQEIPETSLSSATNALKNVNA